MDAVHVLWTGQEAGRPLEVHVFLDFDSWTIFNVRLGGHRDNLVAILA